MPATREAIEWAQKSGLDLAGHRSRGINQEIVSAADLVVVMEQGHKEALNNEFTGIDEKVFTLTELAGKPVFDIPDPYSNIDELPEAVANEIQQLLLKAFDRIILRQGRSLS